MVRYRYYDYGARNAMFLHRPEVQYSATERMWRYSGTTLTEISGAMPAASRTFTL
jgi:hypothetical protein